jgi:hypothetical protein
MMKVDVIHGAQVLLWAIVPLSAITLFILTVCLIEVSEEKRPGHLVNMGITATVGLTALFFASCLVPA